MIKLVGHVTKNISGAVNKPKRKKPLLKLTQYYVGKSISKLQMDIELKQIRVLI
jgi:hypothetical protein